LYRLPDLLKTPLTNTVFVTEGERDSDSLAAIELCATTAGGVTSKWTPELVEHFKDRPVVIFVDADQPGRDYGQKVARALDPVAKSVKLIDLFPSRSDGSDVTDFLSNDRVGVKLLKAVRDAPDWVPSMDPDKGDGGGDKTDDELITELAALPKLQYERRREAAAKQLGIRVSILDKLVEAEALMRRKRRKSRRPFFMSTGSSNWMTNRWMEMPCSAISLIRFAGTQS
jgi:DNA primase